MEDSYASLVSNFIMDPDRLSDDDLDDVELDDEDEEEEEEVDDDFYDFLPFQKEFLMPLRDRAFSWDVSLEDGLHGENMHLFAPTTTAYDNNPKLVIKAKRMHVTKQDSDIIPLPIKMEKDVKKPITHNKTNITTKKGNENDHLIGKNDSVSSPKLSFVLSKSSSNSSSYTLKNTNSSSSSSGTGNTTALAMKPPTRLPSQGNAALASSLSRMSAANNINKIQSLPAVSLEKQFTSSNQVVSPASIPITTVDTVGTTPNNYNMQLQQEQPQLARHNAEIAQEIQALFDYAGGAGDELSDQMFDNSVRNLERIMMHPDESDEDHQRRHAMEMLADQQNLAASSSSPVPQQQKPQEANPQLTSTPLSLNSMLGTSGSSKGPLQGVSGLLGAGGLTGMNGALGGGQIGGLRPMILDGFSNMNDHLLGGGPSPLHHIQRVHGLQPFGSFSGSGGLNSINGNNLSNHILTMNNMSGAGLGGTLGGPLSVGGMHAHSAGSSSGLGGEYRVGAYTREERQMKIEAFRAKKRKRIWRKQIKYDCRKRLADTRPRVKGRFVSRKLGEGDDLLGNGMLDENGDYIMGGGGDGTSGGGGLLNRHNMLLDPHTGLLMGGMNNMNNMMFMNNLAGGGGGGGLASLNSLAAGGMYGGLLPGQQQMPYGGGMNFGVPMLGGMDGSLGGFSQQQPVRQKKNRNHHNINGSQSSGMTGGGSVGGLSSKDLMNFQIQQRYANAVYSGGNGGAGAGGDLMFNPQAGMGGGGNLDFLNNAMLPGPGGNQHQMFMPPLDFTGGPGGLLSLKPDSGSVGVGSAATTNLFNDQMAMLLQQQQQQLLYMHSLTNSFNNNINSSSGNNNAIGLGGELGGLQTTGGGGGPTDGFQQLQHQLLQQQQQQHQNMSDLKSDDAAVTSAAEDDEEEEQEREERAAAEEEDEDEDEEDEDVHEE